jgi:hypothetical protein
MVLLRQCPRRRPGWSLIDLAVLLVILFVAAGLIVPFVMRQQKNSQRAHCSYNLKQLGNAIHLFDEKNGFLPPTRIADDYATWAVLIVPYLEKRQSSDKDYALKEWDVGKRYADQPPELREAWLTQMFCPARQRGSPLSVLGDGDPNLPGAVGDYGCVSGDGREGKLWTGPNANGPMILGDVAKDDKGVILKWRGRTKLDETSLKRGVSVTLLLGEKHVPEDEWGRVDQGDGCIYNGGRPASSARVAGPGYGLAQTRTAAFANQFGGYHTGVCLFLKADMSLMVMSTDMSEEVLGRMAVRDVE